jgi:aldehyde dehydrogenase (NAD+)
MAGALSTFVRARYLYAIARLVQKHSRLLAVLETMDNGKPIRESRDIDIPLVARHFYHHAGLGATPGPGVSRARSLRSRRSDHSLEFPAADAGVEDCAGTGDRQHRGFEAGGIHATTALAFAGIMPGSGLPAGVVNIVTGDGATGEALVKHPDVDKIAFTGSTEVGRAIRAATATSHKRLSLELGGKSPFIVFEDADLDSTVEGLVDGIWFNQGQVCCAGSRLLMQESIAEALIAKIQDRMSTLRIGAPLDKAIDIGAIVARVQLDRIRKLVDQGVADGATCWQPQMTLPSRGFYYPPTLLSNVHPTSIVAQQEIFGPVLAAMTFRTPAEAVELANNTVYGLAACVWSESINVALHVAAQLKAGVVWVNCTNLFDASCGFGGYRESGYGREGGREGLLEYLEPAWFKNAPTLPAEKTRRATRGGIRRGRRPSASANTPDGCDDLLQLTGPSSSTSAASRRVPTPATAWKCARPTDDCWVKLRWAIAKIFATQSRRRARPHRGPRPPRTIAPRFFITARRIFPNGAMKLRIVSPPWLAKSKPPPKSDLSVERIFSYAAWADKFDGAVHNPPFRNIAIAMNEAIGTVGVICPREAPLLGFLSLVMPALAVGNTVIAVPSEAYPLITGDLYQLFDTSDLPGGALNIVTGYTSQLLKTLAEHDDVDAIWCFGDEASAAAAKAMSVGNLKQVWTNEGRAIDWFNPKLAEGRWFLEHATQVKNIWVPYGE